MQSFKKFYNTLLTEGVGLTAGELIKPNGRTGEPRIEILRRLVLSNTPLVTKDKRTFTVTNVDDVIAQLSRFDGSKQIALKGFYNDKSEKIVKANTGILLKTAEFGGGGGITGGTAQTSLVESAQCYYCSALVNVIGKVATEADFTPAVLLKGAKFVFATESVKEVMEKLGDDWVSSSVLAANELFNNGYIAKGSRFYRGERLMKDVYSAKKKVAKNEGVRISDDKWNPGDIWTSKIGDRVNWEDGSFDALNKQIRDLYKSRDVVSISLKKVIKKVSIKPYNVDVEEKPKLSVQSYNINGGKTSKSNFFNNKSIKLNYTDGSVEGRSFNWLTNFSLEIDGKNARGGKVGLGILDFFIKEVGGKALTPTKGIKAQIKKNDEKFLKNFYDLFIKLDGRSQVEDLKFDEFKVKALEKMSDKKGQDWAFSKFYGLEVLDKIINTRRGNEILTSAIAFASSSSNVSSAFIKVF